MQGQANFPLGCPPPSYHQRAVRRVLGGFGAGGDSCLCSGVVRYIAPPSLRRAAM